ncbi:hypothetical protein G6O67_004552 [Ophiocordyceps sinensis]|uniref:Integral membrane protein n=2 Tax=Ophiocordyceps sinensis TaxID=72228 RepID=A0A8H4PPN9_9HYPO|nr:hypothetical protein OCS_01012 [Ophiocordyceps sinensis CO18]KAF4508134.1 hypothetical protein G6O67_004552 [Ophiocordyceps sinensis]
MNTVAAYRRSTILLRGQHDLGDWVVTRRQHEAFTPVDWPRYKQNCELERNSAPIFNVPSLSDFGPDPEYVGFLEGLRRMCTVFPYTDAQWVVAILFSVGSISFIASSFFKLLPLVLPETTFEGELSIGFPATIVTGTATFLAGFNLALIASFNAKGSANRENKSSKAEFQLPMAKYSPALLGTKQWTWCPSWAELRSLYLPNPAFQAGLISVVAGVLLNISAIAGIPGILGDASLPDFPGKLQKIVLLPHIIGAACLAVGGLQLTLLAQSNWYKPAVLSMAWHAAFWNMVGAISLSLSGVFTLLAPGEPIKPAIAFSSATGLFLLASFLQWHMVMAFYPRENQTESQAASVERDSFF